MYGLTVNRSISVSGHPSIINKIIQGSQNSNNWKFYPSFSVRKFLSFNEWYQIPTSNMEEFTGKKLFIDPKFGRFKSCANATV